MGKLYKLIFSYVFWSVRVFCILLLLLSPVYFRLLKAKYPYTLPTNLLVNANYILLFVFFFIWAVWFYLFIRYIRIFLFVTYFIGPMPKQLKIVNYVQWFYNLCLNKFNLVLEFIFKTKLISFYDKIIMPFVLYGSKKITTKRSLFLLFIFIHVIPKLCILIAFYIDFIFYKQFNFVYKIAPMFLIPMIERYLVYWSGDLFMQARVYFIENSFCVYTMKDEVKSVYLYYCELRDKEFSRLLENNTYNINAKFPLFDEELGFAVILHPNFDQFNRHHIANYCQEKMFLQIVPKLYYEFFPIALFSDIYSELRRQWLQYFNVFLSLLYVILWTNVIIYII